MTCSRLARRLSACQLSSEQVGSETVRLEDNSETVDLVVISLDGCPLEDVRLNGGWLGGGQLSGCWLGGIRSLFAWSKLARRLTAWRPAAQRLSLE